MNCNEGLKTDPNHNKQLVIKVKKYEKDSAGILSRLPGGQCWEAAEAKKQIRIIQPNNKVKSYEKDSTGALIRSQGERTAGGAKHRKKPENEELCMRQRLLIL